MLVVSTARNGRGRHNRSILKKEGRMNVMDGKLLLTSSTLSSAPYTPLSLAASPLYSLSVFSPLRPI